MASGKLLNVIKFFSSQSSINLFHVLYAGAFTHIKVGNIEIHFKRYCSSPSIVSRVP